MLSGLLNLLGAGFLGFGNSAISTAYNSREAAKMRKFQSREAQKQRDWMEEMSNTAHQREVDDLYAAGLNPILSANGGSGASVGTPTAPSGAMSHMDPPQTAAMLSALTSGLKAMSELDLLSSQTSKVDAETNFINQQSETTAFERMLSDRRFKFELSRDLRDHEWERTKFKTQEQQFYENLVHQSNRLISESERFNIAERNNMKIQSARLSQEAKLARERMRLEITKSLIQAGGNLVGDLSKFFNKGGTK